jgi:hypothetical protein
MKPFVPITKPEEFDFFSIYVRDGVKYIHLWGYTYESSCSDYESKDNPDGTYWANMEACGLEIPLDEFLSESKEYDGVLEYVNDDLFPSCKQYQGDYTKEEIVEVINHYYRDIVFSVDYPAKNEGLPDTYIDWDEINMDTPCGDYVVKS